MSFRVSIFLLLSLLAWQIAYSQQEDILILKEDKESDETKYNSPELEGETGSGVSNETYLALYEKWREFERANSLGKTNEADRALNEVIRLRNRYSIPKVTELAVGTIRLGNVALSRKNIDQALKLFKAAGALDPSLPLAFYSQARAHLARGLRGLIPSIRAAIEGVLAPLATLGGKIYFYSKFTLILTAALLMLGFVFALALLIQYRTLLVHDILENYGTERNAAVVQVIIWVALFLPVLLFFGPLWLAPFWLMIFWGYSRLQEKIISILFFAIFALAYPVYREVIRISEVSNEPAIALFVDVFSEGPSPKSVANFQKYSNENPADADGAIMLGYLYKTERRYPLAIEVLQKYILNHPRDARGYNNLGAIYFQQGEVDTALRLVQKAAELDAVNELYPFNLAALYRAKFNFSDAEEVLNRARRMDRAYIKFLEETGGGKLIDALPSQDLVRQRIQARAGTFKDYLSNPFSYMTAAMFLATLFLNFGKKKKRGFARECIKCGTPFCKKCQTSKEEYPFCTQCLHIFVKKDGVSPISRREKMKDIDAHSKRLDLYSRLSSLVLPGFGNLVKGHALIGTLTLLFWFFLISFLIFHTRFSDLFYFESAESVRVLTLVCICFMGILYLIANAPLLRKTRA